ncbi:ATP-dependent bile acid permease [Microthyrium microscopicum]|uniref:ATP-dependent bile acid permease n=1 Tax=Microthyrium microscopicum TaxID=703497 RepID=A0A6A6TX68_9PEZI|nr:ATP-dependent bile acid permease [Microthyrium microscopicum]
MFDIEQWPLWLDAAIVGVIVCLAAFAVRTAVQSSRDHPKAAGSNEKYQDADGIATEESQKQFSIGWQNIFLSIFALAGFVVSIAAVVLCSVQKWKYEKFVWMHGVVWILILAISVLVVRERQHVARYQLAVTAALSFIATLISHCVRIYFIVENLVSTSKLQEAFDWSRFALAILGLAVSISYPRRPEVFLNGVPVDAQWGQPAWSRYTYAWANPMLAKARKKKLDHDDLPQLDHTNRAGDLFERFNAQKKRKSLTLMIIISILPGFIRQQFFTLLDAFFNVAPQLALFQLLRILEQKDAGMPVQRIGIFWAFGLGLLSAVSGYIAARTWWYSESSIFVTLAMEFGAIIFAKSMRKKDVKGTAKKKTDDSKTNGKKNDNDTTADIEAATPSELKDDGEDEAEAMRQTRQGVVNLVGVDARRIGNFATVNNIATGSILRLFIAFFFLKQLVGWVPMLIGIAVQLAFLPINIYYSKRYTVFADSLMKQRDKKLSVVNEALSGIRQIKFAALERRWQQKILEAREVELKSLWGVMISDTILIGLWITGPVMLSTACLISYALITGRLEPSVAFTVISVLGKIEGTLSYLPELLTNLFDARISIKRIQDYLEAPDKIDVAQVGDKIAFEDATIAWPADELEEDTFKLHNINIEFPLGELSVISGRTGSGKSLLLSSILGECELISGTIIMPQNPSTTERNDKAANKGNWILDNAVAFVPQIPWIENASFRDNILFGLPFDEERYKQVLSDCALEKDLEILGDGDRTEIGPKGINLSGGQCWRLTLARALYSRAGILVLDDIFSAVDAHVGKHIFENALTGPMSTGRTRILVTHHVALCRSRTKYEVHLGEGVVDYAGLVEELAKTGKLIEHEDAIEDAEDVVEDTMQSAAVERRLSTVSRRLSKNSTGTALERQRTSVSTRSESQTVLNGHAESEAANKKEDPKKFVEKEATETGTVKFRIYIAYMKACGSWGLWVGILIMFGLYEILLLGRTWILRLWTGSNETQAVFNSSHSAFTIPLQKTFFAEAAAPVLIKDTPRETLMYYLTIYLAVTVVMCAEGTLRYYFVFHSSIKASRRMFESLTYAVLRAPLRWLDTVPVGRVLNRFTADFNTLDTTLAYGLSFAFWNFLAVVGIAFAGAIVSPYIILTAFLLFCICAWFSSYYLSGARECKRLESTAKSPIFEHFTAALQGVSSIRAYNKSSHYIEVMFDKLNRQGRCLYQLAIFKRWLSWRFQLVGMVFSTLVAIVLVNAKGMDAALGGFALTFSLSYNESLSFLLRHYTEVELGMNSTERIVEYSEIETENQDGEDVPASWPSEGRMEVENLVVSYASDLPPVLKGLNFEVKPKERIGVVGRTGAGKSSLTLALFRFLEASEGSVHIDGVDISKIKLEDLRSRLAIIPQDPVLFSGTIRSNLDPFDERSDLELKDALERVHLVGSEAPTPPEGSANAPTANTKNVNIFKSLNSAISESGQNLSQGQRQLLCLARAIVARPKIMVLDEATSAVDKNTDSLIQRSIREEFDSSTLLVIAHRLSTIADFDRVLVLDQGAAVEYDTPKNLVEKEDGIFRSMVESSGERDVLMDAILGGEK